MGHGMICPTPKNAGVARCGRWGTDMAGMLPHHPPPPVRGVGWGKACSAWRCGRDLGVASEVGQNGGSDLFAKAPRRVGHGNAMFLADLAENVPDATIRAKFRAGDYPDLHQPSINAWRQLRGRT